MRQSILSILICLFFISKIQSQIPSYLPMDGLQAYYPFNGNTNDESGNGNHGINFGAVLTTDRTMTSSKAYQFGGNARIQIPDSNIKFNSRIISINAWVNYGNTSTTMIVTRRKWTDASSEQFSFDTKAFNVKRNGACAPAVGWVTTNHEALPSVGTWAMLTVTYDGRYMRQYLNGVLRRTNDLGSSVLMDSCSGADIIIGGTWQTFPFYYTGKIDDVSIYNRELTVAEVSKIYNQCLPNQVTNANNVTLVEGDTAEFSVQASVTGATFSWQRRSGTNFVNIIDNSQYIGANTNTLRIANTNISMDSFQFRCIVSQTNASCLDTSSIVRLFVKKRIIKNIPYWLPDSLLVAWYPFNGNAYDESGNGNNGNVIGGAALTMDRKGNLNTAYTFNGTNSRISVPYSNSLQTKLISINFWVRRTNNNVVQYITKRNWADASNEQYSIDNSSINIKQNSNCSPSVGWQTTSYNTGPTLNVWNMLTMTYDGRFLKYYYNGVLNAEKELNSAFRIMDTCNGADLSFGAGWSTFPFWFTGQLDDISIYSRSLSDLEVMQIYTQCVKHISLQPTDFSGTNGDQAMFSSLSRYDTVASYQWQYNTGSGFVNLTPGPVYQGVDRRDLIIGSINTSMNNHQFRCIVSTPYTCADTTNIAKLSVQSVGLNQSSIKTQLSVFPNPTSGDFSIEFSNPQYIPKLIGIYNALGMDVSDQIIITRLEQEKIDVRSRLKEGFYTVLISINDQVVSRKVVISK
ncbi:MAG: T9SS type A sorting domain-containing protein [Bacteroidia bacterium]|nr:T9SS type A sorting domain-containing protein [Bacteroidia bacterium]